MAEIINLRMARKRADRAAREAAATENRARHGLGKVEKRALRAEERRHSQSLDGHRLNRTEDER